MKERSRVSAELLQEIGWVTVQWARLEAYVDLIAVYLHRHQVGVTVPRPFNARLKFIRVSFESPIFINLRAEATRMDEAIKVLANHRNCLVHSVVTKWAETPGFEATILKQEGLGYVAVQGRTTDLDELRALALSINRISSRLFGLMERVKSVVRLFEGKDDFWHMARLYGDRA